MTVTPASIETAPTDPAELATIGRFNVRVLAQKLGIFDGADEAARTAFLAQDFAAQCQQVSDALIEARGGKKAKKGTAAPAAPARTPVNNKAKKAPPPEEEEEEEEVDEEEVDEETEEEVDDEEEEAPPPPPVRRTTGGVPARAPVAAPKAAPAAQRTPATATAAAPLRNPATAAAAPQAGAQLLGVVQSLQKTVNDIAGVVQGLADNMAALQDSIVLGYRHTAIGTSVSLKVAEQALGANAADVIQIAMEELNATENVIAQFISADPAEEVPAAKPKGTKVKVNKGK